MYLDWYVLQVINEIIDKKLEIGDYQYQFIKTWCTIFKHIIVELDGFADKWRTWYGDFSFLFAQGGGIIDLSWEVTNWAGIKLKMWFYSY